MEGGGAVKKLKKIDNGGFSLVELLVAVVILGLIVAPLLQTFVTASGTAARSRKMGDATLASQNIAETIEANDLSSFVGSVSPKNGKYTVSMDGVQAGKSTFKAQVTLDPQTSGTESPFQSINAEKITDYSNMDAVFAQSQDAAEDPDQISLANFNLYAATYTLDTAVTPTVSRLIVMTLSEESGKVYAKLVYTYTYTFTYITIGSDGKSVSTPQTFTDKQTYELFPQGFSPAKVPNIYLMYNPWYRGDMLGGCDKKNDSTYNKMDVIIAEAEYVKDSVNKDIPFQFFLVKQKSSAVTSGKEGQYSADIILKESDSAVYPSTVFSNVNEDVTGTSASRIANVMFKLQSGAYKYTLFTSSITGDLVSKAPKNRIYQVTIKIYPSGTTDYTTPLCTFTTTKLQ